MQKDVAFSNLQTRDNSIIILYKAVLQQKDENGNGINMQIGKMENYISFRETEFANLIKSVRVSLKLKSEKKTLLKISPDRNIVTRKMQYAEKLAKDIDYL